MIKKRSIRAESVSCAPCSLKSRESNMVGTKICGSNLYKTQCNKPTCQSEPSYVYEPTCTVLNIEQDSSKETEECRVGITCYPIDGQEAMWSQWVIGPSYDEQTGIHINYKIPFGFVDFKDLGRSGNCSQYNEGRVYTDEDCNTYQYLNYKLVVRDKNQTVVRVEDNRIPVEALSPYDRCACEPVTEPGCDAEDPCAHCPTKVLKTVCENGVCKVAWVEEGVPFDLSVLDTNTVDLTLTTLPDGTKQLKADAKLVDSPTVDLSATPDGIKADVKISDDAGNGIEVRDDGLYVSAAEVLSACPGIKTEFLDYSQRIFSYTYNIRSASASRPVHNMQFVSDTVTTYNNIDGVGSITEGVNIVVKHNLVTPQLPDCDEYEWLAEVVAEWNTDVNEASSSVFFKNDISVNKGSFIQSLIAPHVMRVLDQELPSRGNSDYTDASGMYSSSTQRMRLPAGETIEFSSNNICQAPNNVDFEAITIPPTLTAVGANYRRWFDSISLSVILLGKIKKV